MSQELTIYRVGNRDRNKTAARLDQALSQGYLELDEYERRMQTTFQTRTVAELKKLLADLPIDRLRRADPRRRAARAAAARNGVRIHLVAYIALTAVLLAVWAAAGTSYFWPIWPILGAAIGLVSHALAVRPAVKRLTNQGV